MQTKLNFKTTYGYDDGEKIYLLYRENGEKKVHVIDGFKWYFLIHSKDFEKAKDFLAAKCIDSVLEEGNYYKIFCKKPWRGDLDSSEYSASSLIKDLKLAGVTPLEADVRLINRFLIDNEVELDENLKVGYFDIETDDSVGGLHIGKYPILSWCIYTDDEKAYFSMERAEPKLLRQFLTTAKKFDVLVGWNINGFDLPYLRTRMDLYSIKYDSVFREIMFVDMMKRYIKLFAPIMSILGLRNFSLDESARVFLGGSKIERTEKICQLYEKNPEKLKEYNIHDCRLLKQLNDKNGSIPLMIKECVWTGSFLNQFFVGSLLDNYILRQANKKGYHLRSRPWKEESEELRKRHITGGYVMEPKRTGLFENIRVFDFKSLYPTIIIDWNLGEDTLARDLSGKAEANMLLFLDKRKIEDTSFQDWSDFLRLQKKELDPKNLYYQSAFNQFFLRGKSSMIGDLVFNLLEQRKEYKKKLDSLEEGSIEFANARAAQEVIKELANSMFGITADVDSRYFDPKICESITYTGQYLGRLAGDVFNKMGYETLYSDTDSIFVSIDNDSKMDDIYKEVNKEINRRLFEEFQMDSRIDITLEYEKKYSKFIMLDKKKYTGIMTWSNGKRVDIHHSRGTENIKKDTIEYTRYIYIQLLQKLLREGLGCSEMQSWVELLKKDVQHRHFSKEELIITQKISKPIAEYKTMTYHTKIAKRLIEQDIIPDAEGGKHGHGARIQYIVVKKGKIALLPEEFTGEFDREYYWEIKIYAPIQRVLASVFPSFNWNQYDKLFNYFEIQENRGQLSLFSY